jgi:hypothetical protein
LSVLRRLLTEAGGWSLSAERSMGSPVIVVGEESGEFSGTAIGAGVGTSVSPAAQEGLDKAFGFAVGARAVSPGSDVLEAEGAAGGGKAQRDVAGAVIGHDADDTNATGFVPGQEASKESDGGGGSLVRQDFGVSHARGIVDADMNEFPSGSSAAVPGISGDAVADDLNASELFDVDVNELSGFFFLIAVGGLLGVEVLKPRESLAAQDAGDGRRAQTYSRSDLGPGIRRSRRISSTLTGWVCRGER